MMTRTRSSAVGAVAVLLAVVLLAAQGAHAAEAVSKEYQIKAAFLYNFAKFVEWPPASFADASSPIIIGVLGQNPFGGELEQVVKDRKINGRDVLIKTLETVEQAASVQIVFLAAGEDARIPKLLAAVSDKAVLTVGESDAFASQGGAIRFVLDGDKVRFRINLTPADRAHLKIGGQLQQLAKQVERSP
ncbi:MAG: YfiR family protein [Stagnimonas sp.]|nr:YfiR family protein [Stagnimonas sp.]